MFNYLAYPWQNHPFHLVPQNPYPAPPPPPPIPHKVWILDCKSCDTFLTNRGMKAVLLLRPNVSLYSSDALPVNCSALTNSNFTAAKPPCRPNPSPVPARTCGCLTQTLHCHGCGNAVGYMIVIPCSRCTSSITATNRATNGHRFVFHASEISGTERHYIPDEPGVIPFDPPLIAVPASPMVSTSQPLVYPTPYMTSRESYFSRHFQTAHPSGPFTPSVQSDFLPTPPLEFAHPVIASMHQEPHPHSVGLDYSHRLPPQLYLQTRPPHRYQSPTGPNPIFYHPTASRPTSPDSSSSSEGSPSLTNPSFPYTDQKEPSLPRTLKANDVLFWHHLARSGEIPAVTEDARARGPPREAAADAKPVGRVMFNR